MPFCNFVEKQKMQNMCVKFKLIPFNSFAIFNTHMHTDW